jgi:hypothetical protein
MMNINRNNYEACFLDYFDGNLDKRQMDELMAFLELNPDLKAEFSSFVAIQLPKSAEAFEGKALLKKENVTLLNYSQYFIAHTEGDLSEAEEKNLRRFLQEHPQLLPELEIFKKLRILPQHEIIFKDKTILKRNTKVIAFRTAVRYAAAAVIAILLLTYFFLPESLSHLAQQQPVNSIPPNTLDIKNIPPATVAEINVQKTDHVTITRRKRDADIPKNKTTPVPTSEEPVAIIPPVVTISQNGGGFAVPSNTPDTLSTAKNIAAVTKPDSPSQLSDVFTNEELQELGFSSSEKNKKNDLFDLAAKGVDGLGKVTGTEMALKKSNDELENTQTVELAIGPFSYVRTVSKQ